MSGTLSLRRRLRRSLCDVVYDVVSATPFWVVVSATPSTTLSLGHCLCDAVYDAVSTTSCLGRCLYDVILDVAARYESLLRRAPRVTRSSRLNNHNDSMAVSSGQVSYQRTEPRHTALCRYQRTVVAFVSGDSRAPTIRLLRSRANSTVRLAAVTAIARGKSTIRRPRCACGKIGASGQAPVPTCPRRPNRRCTPHELKTSLALEPSRAKPSSSTVASGPEHVDHLPAAAPGTFVIVSTIVWFAG
jgi:hypothetical protein